MPVHTCSSCGRLFSSSSNRLRHERLFHRMEETQSEDGTESAIDAEETIQTGSGVFHGNHTESEPDADENDSEQSEHGDETSEASSDGKDDERWVEIIQDACQQYEDLPNSVWEEPHLSQFLEHMKNYVEERFQFVHDMGFNTEYEKIQKMIEKNIQRGYGRQEAVDAAWHARRFLVKQIILDHKDAVNEAENDDE